MSRDRARRHRSATDQLGAQHGHRFVAEGAETGDHRGKVLTQHRDAPR